MSHVNVTLRIEKEVKDKSIELFNELGLTLNQAINIFLKQCVREQGIPFQISTQPFNQETLEAFKEFEEMKNNKEKYKRYDSFDEVLKESK